MRKEGKEEGVKEGGTRKKKGNKEKLIQQKQNFRSEIYKSMYLHHLIGQANWI